MLGLPVSLCVLSVWTLPEDFSNCWEFLPNVVLEHAANVIDVVSAKKTLSIQKPLNTKFTINLVITKLRSCRMQPLSSNRNQLTKKITSDLCN